MKLLEALAFVLSFVSAVAVADVRSYSATVTTDTNVYASGDQLGTLITLTDALAGTNGGRLASLSIVDKAKQKSGLTVLFFRALPTVASSNNAALDISDAEISSKFLGQVPIVAGDYVDLANSSVATYKTSAIDLVLESSNGTLYAIVLSQGTPTYTSATDLILNLGIVRE